MENKKQRSTKKQKMLEDLECPCCFNYVQIPIMTCINKHMLCSQCMSKLDKCPLCRVEYSMGTVENEILGDKTRRLRIPCKNSYNGCPKIVSFMHRERHEIKCQYAMLLCPFADPENPCTHIRRDHLTEHCCQKHGTQRMVSLRDRKTHIDLLGPRPVYKSYVFDRDNVFFLFKVNMRATKVILQIKMLGPEVKTINCCLRIDHFPSADTFFLRPPLVSRAYDHWTTQVLNIPSFETLTRTSFDVKFILKLTIPLR